MMKPLFSILYRFFSMIGPLQRSRKHFKAVLQGIHIQIPNGKCGGLGPFNRAGFLIDDLDSDGRFEGKIALAGNNHLCMLLVGLTPGPGTFFQSLWPL
jgi:hypothetical protein